jgi:hypothetical protein
MVDVFLSYSHDDRQAAKRIAELLEARGYTVWWDREIQIKAGETFNSVIDQQLQSAGCILALWSKTSVNSRWVLDEADVGLERGAFVHVSLDSTRPPLGFRRFMYGSLEHWDGDPNGAEFQEIVKAVEHFVRRPRKA